MSSVRHPSQSSRSSKTSCFGWGMSSYQPQSNCDAIAAAVLKFRQVTFSTTRRGHMKFPVSFLRGVLKGPSGGEDHLVVEWIVCLQNG